MPAAKLNQLSKDVVNLLRHRAKKAGIHVDGGGFADIRLVATFFDIDVELLIEVARIAEKPRLQIVHAVDAMEIDPAGVGLAHMPVPFVLNPMLTRAIQGHSLPQVIPERVYTPFSYDDLVEIGTFVHGTNLKAFWDTMRHGQKPGGGGEGRGKGRFHRRKVNMLSRGGFDETTNARMGIREKSVVHIFYPAERCAALFMGVSVAGAYCTTADIPWQCVSHALIGRSNGALSLSCGMKTCC